MSIAGLELSGPPDSLPAGETITLGVGSFTHLGDSLCLTPLPRLLRERGSAAVLAGDTPNCRAVFANNPHVSGFAAGGVNVFGLARGCGHLIQRLQQGLELPIDPVPRPEVFLSDAEINWAVQQRRLLPGDRPICVLSTAARTDRGNLEKVDWESMAAVLAERYVVVQPVLDEKAVHGTVVMEHLPVRHYMALISMADCFVGGTSGGSHLAAAFDVPALVIGWRSMLDHVRFPVAGLWSQAAFLYPQQWFIASEDAARGSFRHGVVRSLLADLAFRGGAGRATAAGSHPSHPCGFAPAPSRQVLMTAARRFIRIPRAPERPQHADPTPAFRGRGARGPLAR